MDHHRLRDHRRRHARSGERAADGAPSGPRGGPVRHGRNGREIEMTKSRPITLAATATILALCAGAIIGCKREGNAPGVVEAPTRSPGLKIAMIAKSSTNPVFLSARTGAEAAAKELSQKHNVPIEVVWLTPPAEDGQVQAQRLAQAVNEGATAALISCSDAGKVTGAINDAVARGVPVMTFDSDAPESKRFAFYGVDDMKTGQAVMDELAAQMGGQGSIAILAGNQNAPNLRKRVDGVKDEIGRASCRERD